MLADRDTGRCIVTTSWRDEAALHSSAETSGRTRSAPPSSSEVRRSCRSGRSPRCTGCWRRSGARSRVTWLRTRPDGVNRAVDAVRLSLMPKLDDLPGFCSVSVMVRREEGLTVAAVSYDSRAHLEQAGEGAREFREEFAPAMGIEVVDTAEFDVAIAHLRVPETI